MTIQVNFREAGGRLADIDSLEKAARALKATGESMEVLVYFEFEDPQQVLTFCNAVKMIDSVGELNDLEKKKEKISEEIDQLMLDRDSVRRETQKRRAAVRKS